MNVKRKRNYAIATVLLGSIGTIGGELASDQARTSRHNLAFGGPSRGSDHDAAMRIGGEAPGGGSILERGMQAMAERGSPPPRIVIGGSSYEVNERRIWLRLLSH